MNCGKCGGECYDNREQKASGKYKPNAPDFACKDKACGWKLWPPKEKKDAKPQASVAPKGPKWTWASLQQTYSRCLLIAEKQVFALGERRSKLTITTEDVLSGAHTLLIAVSRDGVKELEPLAPPQQPLNEYPKQLAQGDEEEEMPF